MKKRPDAESILFKLFIVDLFVGFFVSIIGIGIFIKYRISWVLVLGILMFLSIGIIEIINKIHNVLLDIRDAAYRQNQLLEEISDLLNAEKTSHPNHTSFSTTAEAKDFDKLQEWKATQLSTAKVAFEEGKITQEKYDDYVAKVFACKKIPEKK